MGFINANMIPILREHKRQSFSGKLLLLGNGDIYFSDKEFIRMAGMLGIELDMSIAPNTSCKPDFALKGYLDAETVFKRIGFSKVHALDYSNFEGADIIHDLNTPDVPMEWLQQFDVVIDHGTLEHVFHLPHALKAVFNFLKVGGRVIISSPSNGFFDHGFYMFQPTLFLDYFNINKWDIVSIQVAQFSYNQEIEPCFFSDYYPGQFDAIGYGKMGEKLYSTICVAIKQKHTISDAVPQQGCYSRQQNWIAGAPMLPEVSRRNQSQLYQDRGGDYVKKNNLRIGLGFVYSLFSKLR